MEQEAVINKAQSVVL
ncbi:hypothetical protein EC940618_5302, partial [Escherichia coli 94.0618]